MTKLFFPFTSALSAAFDVLPVKGDGEARDEYTKVGGAAKEIARAAAKAVSWASFIVDSSFK